MQEPDARKARAFEWRDQALLLILRAHGDTNPDLMVRGTPLTADAQTDAECQAKPQRALQIVKTAVKQGLLPSEELGFRFVQFWEPSCGQDEAARRLHGMLFHKTAPAQSTGRLSEKPAEQSAQQHTRRKAKKSKSGKSGRKKRTIDTNVLD